MALSGEDLELQIVERPGKDGETSAYLIIRNGGSEALDRHWRLYFSLGLKPGDDEARVRRVIVDGRYGYLEPDEWEPLPPESAVEIPIENWVFNRMPMRARQGFHVTILLDGGNRDEPVLPRVLPPVLLPLTKLENTFIPALSPSSDIEFQSPEHTFEKNLRSLLPDPGLTILPSVNSFKPVGGTASGSGFEFDHEELEKVLPAGQGIRVSVTVDPDLSAEAYILNISETGTDIQAGSSRGVYYGAQTLRQLITTTDNKVSIPCCRIRDKTDFEHRGLFIDIARHFQSADDLKKVIRAMSAYKMNRLQLGISNDEGWRLEIEGLPELTEVGARRSFFATGADGRPTGLYPAWGDGPEEDHRFLTRQAFANLINFAAKHHVDIIVELNLPAHANALIRAMEASGRYRIIDPLDESTHRSAQGYSDNVVNVSEPDTYVLIEQLITGISDCYRAAGVPMKRIHLGGDEVPEGAWQASPVCAGAGTATLLETYTEKVLAIIEAVSPGTRVGFWHEMSPYLPTDAKTYITGWTTEAMDRNLIQDVLAKGQKLVIANASFLYLDMPYGLHADEPGLPWAAYIDSERIYDFDPLGCWDITGDQVRQVPGIQAQLWSETITTPELMDYHLFPRLLAVAERAWRAEPSPDGWPGFAHALGSRELPFLASLGIAFRLPPPGARIIDGKLHANVAFPGLVIRYTTDGSDPTADSSRYTGPLALTSTIRLASFTETGDTGGRTITINPS